MEWKIPSQRPASLHSNPWRTQMMIDRALSVLNVDLWWGVLEIQTRPDWSYSITESSSPVSEVSTIRIPASSLQPRNLTSRPATKKELKITQNNKKNPPNPFLPHLLPVFPVDTGPVWQCRGQGRDTVSLPRVCSHCQLLQLEMRFPPLWSSEPRTSCHWWTFRRTRSCCYVWILGKIRVWLHSEVVEWLRMTEV